MLVDARKDLDLSQADVARTPWQTPGNLFRADELGERRLDVFEFVDVATALGLDGLAEIRKITSA